MTALNIATQIPTNITTLEELLAWAVQAAAYIDSGVEVLEVAGQAPVSVAQASVVRAADDTIRLIARVSIEMDPTYVADRTKKFWEFSKEWSNAAMPSIFTTN